MGKANRRIKKRQQEKIQTQQREINVDNEERIRQQMAAEQYEKVIETLADLVKGNDIKPEFIYDGAYAYFMVGDYERAAVWIDNTLHFAPTHIPARLLLARLCTLQDRASDGLAVYEFLLTNWKENLTAQQLEEIEEQTEYYARNEAQMLCQQYPQLAKLVQAEPVKQTEPETVVQAEEMPVKQEQERPVDMLRQLKAKIASATGAPVPEPEKEKTAVTETVENKKATVSDIQEILQKPIAIKEKIHLLQTLAGGCYMQADLATTAEYLKAALQLDPGEETVLRNLALVIAEQGDKDKALQYVANMAHMDFLLLRAIRER
ncbi:hypothetical protein SAMN02910356_01141 [Selenomonas sp. GACV-9]|uniref:hypothetical protein n=1 Tax=Selenomonas sp. GACV-9 TaxID=3158782 RepID=UPI0008E980ED|nr:hypothetical protein SAMN02910356_01141 [Selenomonas ruminantium]